VPCRWLTNFLKMPRNLARSRSERCIAFSSRTRPQIFSDGSVCHARNGFHHSLRSSEMLHAPDRPRMLSNYVHGNRSPWMSYDPHDFLLTCNDITAGIGLCITLLACFAIF
jgi:hypothetical protein